MFLSLRRKNSENFWLIILATVFSWKNEMFVEMLKNRRWDTLLCVEDDEQNTCLPSPAKLFSAILFKNFNYSFSCLPSVPKHLSNVAILLISEVNPLRYQLNLIILLIWFCPVLTFIQLLLKIFAMKPSILFSQALLIVSKQLNLIVFDCWFVSLFF